MCVHHSVYVIIVTYDSYSISMTADASKDYYMSGGKEQTQKGRARQTSMFMSSLMILYIIDTCISSFAKD